MVNRIALLTAPRYLSPRKSWLQGADALEEDRRVVEALAARGVASERVAWSCSDVVWSDFDAAVFRTTWDYHEHLAAFLDWLDRMPVPLLNRRETIRWNLDKAYLLEMEAKGVAIVPTHREECRGSPDLDGILAQRGWTDAVIKPAVSAGAHQTWRSGPEASLRWAELIAEKAMIVQPFQRSIVEQGEVALMLFGGRYSHAVLKRPRRGDFRVQDDHGGTLHAWEPDRRSIDFAEAAVAACGQEAVYARVDLVHGSSGEPRLMELELIEPELWFRRHPVAAERFAEAVVASFVGT